LHNLKKSSKIWIEFNILLLIIKKLGVYMKNNFFKNRIAVITGGESPLSKALAIEIALLKGDVILVGNKKEELLKTIKEIDGLKKKTGRIFAVSGDLSTKEGCEAVLRDAKKIAGTFEILINNGSIFSAGKFEDEKIENIKKSIDVNVTGTMLLTKLSLSTLKSNKKPGIINICNFFGKIGLPYFSVYSATKFAIAGFTEALQKEYSGEGFKIMGVYAPTLKSELTDKREANLEKIGLFAETPEEVAKKIIEAYNELETEIVLGKKEKSLIFWKNLRKKSTENYFKKMKPKILSAISE